MTRDTKTPPDGIFVGLTDDEIEALPAVIGIATAGRAFGLGETKARELAKRNEFPVAVMKVGARHKVSKHKLLEALGKLPAA